jgi:hypothetical protein
LASWVSSAACLPASVAWPASWAMVAVSWSRVAATCQSTSMNWV